MPDYLKINSVLISFVGNRSRVRVVVLFIFSFFFFPVNFRNLCPPISKPA